MLHLSQNSIGCTTNGRALGRIAVFLLILVLLPFPSSSQQHTPASHVLVEGEDLIYNVRYGIFDLGQVRIKTIKKLNSNGTVAYQTIAYIDSYKKVPFVKLNAVFESLIDSEVFSRFFVGKSRDGDYWNFGRYTFDYVKKLAYLESGSKDTLVEKRDTLFLDGSTQDGLSLFFYARDHLFSGKRHVIPAIVKEKKVYTTIQFHGRSRAVEYDLIDYPVDAVGFEGTMEFTGIFGLTGDFEGWFSNDDARIPIIAKMKVILGSVTIELMQWKRDGWKPPVAKN
ncbi:MAG: DUF3108 domain-containing protein [Bacteroidetes bacterium]|nr:DUF3108 domain-containing protein [Bacteroidota bacterium]MCW5897372.1 DUF3108 domain-containing protein [Bacteroidota bacterium]